MSTSNKIIDKTLENMLECIELSPSSAKNFEQCPASFIHRKILFPRISTEDALRITTLGSVFHDWAEHDFDEKLMDTMLSELTEEQRTDVLSFAETVMGRDYFEHEHENEIWLSISIKDNWKMRKDGPGLFK